MEVHFILLEVNAKEKKSSIIYERPGKWQAVRHISGNLYKNPMMKVLLSLFYKWGTWGWERLSKSKFRNCLKLCFKDCNISITLLSLVKCISCWFLIFFKTELQNRAKQWFHCLLYIVQYIQVHDNKSDMIRQMYREYLGLIFIRYYTKCLVTRILVQSSIF